MNLRISDACYFSRAAQPGRMVGRLDAAPPARWAPGASATWEFDPGIEAIGAVPYTAAAMAYFRPDLGLPTDQRYEVMSGDAHKAWNWNRGVRFPGGIRPASPAPATTWPARCAATRT
jgi:hypothetical protein